MRIGLLWYDSSKNKSVKQRIDEAVERYNDRFGAVPNTCHVNPEESLAHPHLRIVPDRHIRPNHYWLGEDEEDTTPASA